MNASVLERRLLAPRPGLLCGRLALGLAVPVVMLVFAVRTARVPGFGIFAAVFIAAQVACAIATAHKEILAASPSFFRPGLRRQLFMAQLAWALAVVATLAVCLRVAYPALPATWLGSTCGAALAAFALAALATLWLGWSFQLPLWLYYAFILMPAFVRAIATRRWDAALGTPVAWLAAGVLLLVLLGRTLTSRDVHRRLSGSLVLGVDDVFRPGRLRQYKSNCGGWNRAGDGPRWRQRLIAAPLRRAALAYANGKVCQGRAWQALAIDAASISPRARVVVLTVAGMLVMTLFFGYYDSFPSHDSRWFAGLVYQWALFPAYGLSTALLTGATCAVSRRTGYRSELAALGWVAAMTVAAALLTAGLFAALAAVMPPLPWGGHELVFRAARPHGIWLVPLLVPFGWLAVALKPRPQSPLAAFLLGPMFIGGHAALSQLPYRVATPYCVAASALAFAAAAALRRRWWERADFGK
jgi:hypothetical protein